MAASTQMSYVFGVALSHDDDLAGPGSLHQLKINIGPQPVHAAYNVPARA